VCVCVCVCVCVQSQLGSSSTELAELPVKQAMVCIWL
jgi:hypothetical protein